MPSISSSSRTAVAAGLAVVTVLAATTISPAALMVPIALIAVLLLAPSRRPQRQTPTVGGSATFSAQLRAVSFPSSSISLLHAAIGASIGLAYVVVVMCL